MLPTRPQLLLSPWRSTQLPLDVTVSPGRHAHVPPQQIWSALHAEPRAPQLFGSDVRSTQ